MSAKQDAIVKARVFASPGDVQLSNAIQHQDDESLSFERAGALEPPYDPRKLCSLFERSSALRPNIDAYCVNIEAFGHRLEPTINLDSPNADDQIRDSILLERMYDGESPIVTELDVKARRLEIESTMRIERLQLELFFQHACPEGSFVELRERTRSDEEVTGNAYWEVLRNGAGQISQLVYVPAISTRLRRASRCHTEIDAPQKISAVSYRYVKQRRRFRSYVQIVNSTEAVYFKELGDPRVMSSASGQFYDSEQALQTAEPGVSPATEILHFKVHSPVSAYGVPRWIGTSVSVCGSRAAEEVNADYFDNKAVPPLAVLVSGGTLSKGATDRIQNYVERHIKGRKNFHSILLLEAESSAGNVANGSKIRIELKPLTDAQHSDALFQEYDANNTEKIGNSFRLPKLLRGNTNDFNRATAESALQYAEQQVFQPEREKFDHIMNTRVLAAMGVRFWQFKSNAPVVKDPEVLSRIIAEQSQANNIVPSEARELLQDVFNRPFAPIEQPWASEPFARIAAAADGVTAAANNNKQAAVDTLISIRDSLVQAEDKDFEARSNAARQHEAEQVLHVPSEEFASWFVEEPAA